MDNRLGRIQDELLAPLSSDERGQLTRLLARLLDHHTRKAKDADRDRGR